MTLACVGCSTHAKRLRDPRTAFYNNDLSTANQLLQKLNEKPKRDSSVIELDLAMTELFQGNVVSAENRLRAVRDEWDHLEQRSLAEETASYLTDDRTRAYAGEDYERILIRVWLTLCSLMKDGVDAESYSLQTLQKQQDLLAKARKRWDEEIADRYCVPPFAPYLRGVLKESSLQDYREAEKFYRQAEQLLPESPVLLADIARSEHGVHSQPGMGAVYIFALVGRGPYKVEEHADVTRHMLQAVDVLVSQVGEYTVPPTLAPVKIPKVVTPAKSIDLIGVEVNGVPTSTTLPMGDLHALAEEALATKRHEIIVRSAARRIIKKGAVYAAKDELNVNSDIASLALDAAGVLWEASESADTRCWGLLPREIQVLRLELPKGTHLLNLEPVVAGSPVAAGKEVVVDVFDARNTYVLSYWPDHQPVGKILVKQPSH